MLSNISKNCMGTVSFDGKFGKMRKVADFCVYPIEKSASSNVAKIQSDGYSGFIDLRDDDGAGDVYLAKGQFSFAQAKRSKVDKLSADEFAELVAAIKKSANPRAGSNGVVYCDNSGASGVAA